MCSLQAKQPKRSLQSQSYHPVGSVGEMWVMSIIAFLWWQEFSAGGVWMCLHRQTCVMFSLWLWCRSDSARRGKLQQGWPVFPVLLLLLPLLFTGYHHRIHSIVIIIFVVSRPHNTFSLCSHPTLWRPEYGSYMIEGTPGQPYGGTMSEFNTVEGNMGKRRREASSVLNQNQTLCTITSFPM